MTTVNYRPGTAVSRTVDLLQAIDLHARDETYDEHGNHRGCDPEALALRHLVECLTRIVQSHPAVAEFAEGHVAQAAEALGLIEEGS